VALDTTHVDAIVTVTLKEPVAVAAFASPHARTTSAAAGAARQHGNRTPSILFEFENIGRLRQLAKATMTG
jgi:hypothetical protein